MTDKMQKKIADQLILLAVLSSIAIFLLVIVQCDEYYCWSDQATLFHIPNGPNGQKIRSDGFADETVESSLDGTYQPIRVYRSTRDTPQPLIVSLHTWSGDYRQKDPLAPLIRQQDWNYLRPNLRGPNQHSRACLSDAVIADFDDSIDYLKKQGLIDGKRIVLIGHSGGGYTALGLQQRARSMLKYTMAWSPITDLLTWYHQIVIKGEPHEQGYLQDIAHCTGSARTINVANMNKRSPIHWPVRQPMNGQLAIYSGIHDGQRGSVPIMHSINFYNKLVSAYLPIVQAKKHWVDEKLIAELVTNGRYPMHPFYSDKFSLMNDHQKNKQFLGDRKIIFKRTTEPVSLTLFEGHHEILHTYIIDHLIDRLSQ